MLPTNWSLRQEIVGSESYLLTYGSPKGLDKIDVVSHNLCLMHQILTCITYMALSVICIAFPEKRNTFINIWGEDGFIVYDT